MTVSDVLSRPVNCAELHTAKLITQAESGILYLNGVHFYLYNIMFHILSGLLQDFITEPAEDRETFLQEVLF